MNSLAGAVVLTKTGGILGPIAGILGWIMDLLFRFTSTFGIENIGLCIILFTLVTKILMMPLTIKQQKSSKLMAVMQPEINAIQKKYKGKENDQKSAMMMQAEMKAGLRKVWYIYDRRMSATGYPDADHFSLCTVLSIISPALCTVCKRIL